MSHNSPYEIRKKIIVDYNEVPQNEPLKKRKSIKEKINIDNNSKISACVFLNFDDEKNSKNNNNINNNNNNDFDDDNENDDIFDDSIFKEILKENSNKNNSSSLSQPIVGPISKLRMKAKKLNFNQKFGNEEEFNNNENNLNIFPAFCSKRTYYK